MKSLIGLIIAGVMFWSAATGLTDRVEEAGVAKVETAVSNMVSTVEGPMQARQDLADTYTDELDRIEGITQ